MKPSSSSSTIKLLCSYGGKILPRYQDAKLRYHGGDTRVLAVQRSISFHELLMKLAEICGESVSLLRCQLPTEDLDALVSITSDEDLENIIEEYDRVAPSSPIKIRAFISVPKRLSPHSPTSSFSTTNAAATSSSSSSSPKSYSTDVGLNYSIQMSSNITSKSYSTNVGLNTMGKSYSTDVGLNSSNKSVDMRNQRLSRCHMSAARPLDLPLYYDKTARKLPQYAYGNLCRQMYLVHNGNY